MKLVITIEIDEKEGKIVDSKIEQSDQKEFNDRSQYARYFDESCTGWTKDSEFNLMYLKRQQMYLNDMLRRRGHLFLNEVYDMLGIPRTSAGCVVGWIYDGTNPIGDNFVDFGIYDMNDQSKVDFVNGRSNVILLDFNVDGNILTYLED